MGGQLWPGDPGGQEQYVYHACRHRNGPQCHPHDTEVGLAARRQERLPVPAVPVVFIRPQALRALVRRHQQDRYALWRRAAAHARRKLAADPPDVGGLSGVLGLRPTWTRTLVSPPPGHCLVPAGGVSADRTAWRPARPSSLGPVHALAKLVRGLLLDLVRQARPDRTLPEGGWITGGALTVNRPRQAGSTS